MKVDPEKVEELYTAATESEGMTDAVNMHDKTASAATNELIESAWKHGFARGVKYAQKGRTDGQ